MASRVSWSAKYAPDPKDPRYVKIVGSYARDFLDWAKLFGIPTWSPRGDACVLSAIKREESHEKDEAGALRGISINITSFGLYWPLHVLEPIYEASLKLRPVGGLIINGEQKFYLR